MKPYLDTLKIEYNSSTDTPSRLWNNLPVDIQISKSINIFKRKAL